MEDADLSTFEGAFRRLSGALNRKWTTADYRTAVQVHFDALKHCRLDDVLGAAATLQGKHKWPRLADWFEALPKAAPVGERIMRSTEVDTYLQALRQHYHGSCCDCLLCQEADVTNLPLRFVPDFMPDDVEERAFCPPLNRVVVVGHWAHGYELRRWYAAKDAFKRAAPARYRELVLVHVREPGEEG
jgi:hypothetical protein